MDIEEGEFQGNAWDIHLIRVSENFQNLGDYPDKESFSMSHSTAETLTIQGKGSVESCNREAPSPIQNRSSMVIADGSTGILRVMDSTSIPER